jgi:hypothetical protein
LECFSILPSSDAKQIYFTGGPFSFFGVYSLITHTTIFERPINHLGRLALSQDKRLIYLTEESSFDFQPPTGIIGIIRADNFQIMDSIKVGFIANLGTDHVSTDRIVIRSDKHIAYVTTLSHVVLVVDLTENKVVKTIELSSGNTQIFDIVLGQKEINNSHIWTMDLSGLEGYNPLQTGSGDAGGNQNYTAKFGGTSASCPQVAGVAALILSLNSNPEGKPTNPQVQDIIKQTADDMGATGYDQDFGYGRLNAYQALLLTHAYSNKSMSATATARNNGRRLARDASDRNHLIFASGGEIFYRRSLSPPDDNNWEAPIRLSSGNGSNDFPCITLHNTSDPYVVWQRKTGATTYEIWFAMTGQFRGVSRGSGTPTRNQDERWQRTEHGIHACRFGFLPTYANEFVGLPNLSPRSLFSPRREFDRGIYRRCRKRREGG